MLAPMKFATALISGLAVVALFLAVVGLYGVIAYARVRLAYASRSAPGLTTSRGSCSCVAPCSLVSDCSPELRSAPQARACSTPIFMV